MNQSGKIGMKPSWLDIWPNFYYNVLPLIEYTHMIVSQKRKERLERFNDIDLYVVTCEPLSNGRGNLDVLDAVIKGGATIIQLRDKQAAPDTFLEQARRFRAITARTGVLLIINDYIDIALAVDADGVHLGQTDMQLPFARNCSLDLVIGRSTHNLEQAREAERQGADYINIGPLFSTTTKAHDRVLGVEAIHEISPHISVPFTVMGGITEQNIGSVLAAGATKIAVVTAVTQAPDMAGAVRRLRNQILTVRCGNEPSEEQQT